MSKSDLKKYTIMQILDYVQSMAKDEFVSRSTMKKLKMGVENICLSAFGKENMKLIKKEVPKIIRASLDARQMGFGAKVLKFLDKKRKKRSDEIYNIFSDILNRDRCSSTSLIPSDVVKHSWIDKIKLERSNRSKQRVAQ